MGHDWVLEVLQDLQAYARANGLPGLAAKADEALSVARAEIAEPPEAPPQPGRAPPRSEPTSI